tara:strand:+ start:557 stop:733 length:177 start_codon:yes stop_codon:yes gene_type:complete
MKKILQFPELKPKVNLPELTIRTHLQGEEVREQEERMKEITQQIIQQAKQIEEYFNAN